MQIRKLGLGMAMEVIPTVYEDDRGYFYESFNDTTFFKNNLPYKFVQDNQSFSKKGVLRGLHYQCGGHSQGKLVRVTQGAVLDVIVDLRKRSDTFGKHVTVELNDQKHNMLWVPRGFAHGFLALTDCVFQYKCDNYFNAESDCGIIWNDPTLAIEWGIDSPLLSEKDASRPLFDPTEHCFENVI